MHNSVITKFKQTEHLLKPLALFLHSLSDNQRRIIMLVFSDALVMRHKWADMNERVQLHPKGRKREKKLEKKRRKILK